MDDSTHVGISGSVGDGPYVQIWLKVEEGIIERAAFRTPGCPSSRAAASVLCLLITGRSVEKARTITARNLNAVVGDLPPGKGHYIEQAIIALTNALEGEV